MQTKADIYLSQLKKSNSIRKLFRQTLPALSLVVALTVFWGLKLTGITMAGEAFCGMEEHIHSGECPLQTLVCQLEETEPHAHTESCIYRELTCQTEETEGHTHTESCLSRILICGQEEQDGHFHGPECQIRTLTCEQAEFPAHIHGDGCTTAELICTEPETEGHSHGSGCYQQELACGLEESEEHTHDDSCMASTLVCTVPETEGHSHGSGCWEISLTCTEEETPGHAHDNSCYITEEGYSCGLEEMEPHAHSDSCYQPEEGVYICGSEEFPAHSHGDDCFQFGTGFGCGLTEAEGHVHTAECITEETQLSCGLEATEGHLHGEGCYDIFETCPLEEHIHVESCYSDITADLETSDDWEMTLAGLLRSTRTADNIVMVARVQLGYTESTRNFQVDELGIRRGITRYGQWYGNPYGDWSAMFVSFCLYYAGVEEVPANAGPEALRLEWEAAGLYQSAELFSPVPGHLLFLDEDDDDAADAVAIIAELEETAITLIQGDCPTAGEDGTPRDCVAQTSLAYDDPSILGYGLVPMEPEVMLLPAGDTTVIAKTTAYDPELFTDENQFVVYTTSGSSHFAFDGNGNAVPIYIDAEGNISTDLENPDILLWSFDRSSGNNYYIQNLSTGRYMHAHSTGVTTSGRYTSLLVQNGETVKVRSNTEYARMNAATGSFTMTQNQTLAANYRFGYTSRCTVWLDGTNGGIMSLEGSPNRGFPVNTGDTMILPDSWDSPEKYSYTLRGWYDVVNGVYYPPGAEITVTEHMVFYADWAASSYNIGQYNAQVSDTVSTSDFVTTRVFDYGVLFNVLSSYADVEVSASGHSETWHLLSSGSNAYNGDETLNFIFRDWDQGSRDISYPANLNDDNNNGSVNPGIYSSRLHEVLFGTGTEVIGKQYLGTGDHLFQYMSDPSGPYYGYYYYDSALNAASYNRSAGRFYVYDYLESTRDSAANGKYSDFLPLNSPYVNTQGKDVPTYSYSGDYGEYPYTSHYMYDAKYNTSGNSTGNVGTNYFFGMSIDVNFYLPNSPGTLSEDGTYGNRDVYGKEMHFKFSGDDDVWVLVDGRLVLDIGGIHGIESGDINFSTGAVTVNGAQTGSVTYLEPGDHKLTILYLERGSSQSNCAIFFNLAPRFSFSIQKEDVLTQEVLNGAQFSVYTDKSCTVPAELWVSKASHDRGDAPTNVFTVSGGRADMWGMSAGNTYYIRETRPPDDISYTFASGIICVSIDKQGLASYNVDLIDQINPDGTTAEVSSGFTVHGFRIDEQTQSAYIVATNAPEWVQETTSVAVHKVWSDSSDHSGDVITVYLTVIDPDGTLRRIREVQIGQETGWSHVWDNLPKTWEDGTPIQYGVAEAMVPGYAGRVEPFDPAAADPGDSSSGGFSEATGFENGGTYLLQTKHGYLAASGNNLRLITDAEEAQTSDNSLWTASVNSDGTAVLTNKAGQTLYWNNYAFRAAASPGTNRNLKYTGSSLSCTVNHGSYTTTYYPIDNSDVVSNIRWNGVLYSVSNNPGQALAITLWKQGSSQPEPTVPAEGDVHFRITNIPAGEAVTSLTVKKVWDTGPIHDETMYDRLSIRMDLLANGSHTGMSGTVNLQNGWTFRFPDLPMYDSSGSEILYSVTENWDTTQWIPTYGEVTSSGGTIPAYYQTVTNTYRTGGPELPSTGSAARMLYILCGYGIIAATLVYAIGSRRRRERRLE